MKRFPVPLSLLVSAAVAVAPLAASAAPPSAQHFDTLVTRSGRTFYDCQIVRVHPDGVAFTHRDGAAKIPFKDLPEKLRRDFKYDPKAEAEYQREQAALRKAQKERQRQREIAMEEQLAEAQMAEASYLASAASVYNAAAPMSPALPGEPVQSVSYASPSWVGTPITGTAFGSGRYRRSWSGYYPFGYGYGYGYGYPTAGYTYPAYTYPSYSYPYRYGGYARPTVFGSWNVGHGIHVGVGVTPFGGGIRVFR